MRTITCIIICTILLTYSSCRQALERGVTTDIEYFDLTASDTVTKPVLFAVTDEEFIEYGARVAYVDQLGDTIIPFGQYVYFGTDSLVYYANVMSTPGWRSVGINCDQKVLFDLVTFDNGPDPFSEGLTRVKRNGKMGYANKYGQIVIPCIYDYAKWFDGGVAEVTFDATEYLDGDEHTIVESKEWFTIDKRGQEVK